MIRPVGTNDVTTMNTSFKNLPQLLVSVKSLCEAGAADLGGADWIDLKEPSQGPLGPVDVETGIKVAEQFADYIPVSAAGGELLDWNRTPGGIPLVIVPGIRVLKLGLAGCANEPCWREMWQVVQDEVSANGKELAAVAYADWANASAPQPEQIIEHAAAASCKFFLIDTFNKLQGHLCNHLSTDKLQSLTRLAKEASMQTVLAGSLTASVLPQVLTLPIDIIAVRGAVCEDGRTGIVSRMRVEQFKSAMVRGEELGARN